MFLLVIISAQRQTNQKEIKPLFSVGHLPSQGRTSTATRHPLAFLFLESEGRPINRETWNQEAQGYLTPPEGAAEPERSAWQHAAARPLWKVIESVDHFLRY